MPLLPDDAKPALLDEQMALRNAQAGWGAVAAAIGPITGHLWCLPSAVCGVMVTVLQRQANAIDRALADPPRKDFSTRTVPRRRRYAAGQLGTEPLAVISDDAALATLQVVAYLEAFVRAEERAQGALADGFHDVAGARLAEAERYLEGARRSEALLADVLGAVGNEWASFAFDPEVSAMSASPRDTEDESAVVDVKRSLSGLARSLIRRTGLVIDDLNLAVPMQASSIGAPLQSLIINAAVNARELALSARTVSTRVSVPSIKPLRVAELETRPVPLELEDLPQTREYGFGVIEQDRGNLKSAEAWFERAAATGDLHAMYQLGVAARDEPDQAARWLEQAAADGHSGAMVELGRIEQRQGRGDAAVEWMRRAAELGNGDAMFDLGVFEQRRRNAAEAERWFRQALRVPRYVSQESRGSRMIAYRALGLPRSEITPETALHLGRLLEEQGQLAEARAAYELAQTSEQGAASEAALELGRVREEAGDIDGAIAVYRETVEAARVGDRPAGLAALRLGNLLESRGDRRAARAAYVRATEIDEGTAAVTREALSRLDRS